MIFRIFKFVPYILLLILPIALYIILKDGSINLLFATSTHSDIPSQVGKVMIVTGANTGVGFESCKEFIKAGGTCIGTARTIKKALEAEQKLNGLKFAGKAIGMELELADHVSILNFAKEFRKLNLPLHVLMLNAGVMAMDNYDETKDGLEMQVGVNFVGHYYLNTLLQDLIEKQPSRVIILSSTAHESILFDLPSYSVIQGSGVKNNYWPWSQYGYSKLFNIYHAQELHERMVKKNKNVIVVAVHPGMVYTEIGRHAFPTNGLFDRIQAIVGLTPSNGAVTQMYAATTIVDDPFTRLSGKYMIPQAKVAKASPMAYDVPTRKKVIKEVEEIISKWETI